MIYSRQRKNKKKLQTSAIHRRFSTQQERGYSVIQSRSSWRLDRQMKGRLILRETGFTRQRFFISYSIDVDTFYLFLN